MPRQPNETLFDYAQRLGVKPDQQPLETILNCVEEIQLMKLVVAKHIHDSKPKIVMPAAGLKLRKLEEN